MRRIVYPGDMISESKMRARGVYVENGRSYASLVGMYDDEKGQFIPIEGVYEPREDDLLIGVVSDVKPNGYLVDVGLPNNSFISSKDFRDKADAGRIVLAKVRAVDEIGNITLSDPSIIEGGTIIQISPVKVPRVIGKNGSMLAQIKEATGSRIIVSKNGWIWISGGNAYLASQAMLKIEAEAHTSGLTDRIMQFLEKGGR